jgi:hypothetical protein|tara:strand:+ start:530 stop:778 length:249 start_codon:yes stop_codon:yes gene_type:complete
MLKADGYNQAIMGTIQRAGQDDIILYDSDEIIKILVYRDNMSYEEAVEYFEFNILGSWVGPQTPAYFSKDSLRILKEEEELE